MIPSERADLVAPCGIDCGLCELHVCDGDERLMAALADRGLPREALPCHGCLPSDGDCPVISGECATYQCSRRHDVRFCSDCGQFPCQKLHPSADRADVLPHNLKVYNLMVVKRRGVERFVDESAAIRDRYYRGSMVIGAGPRVGEPEAGPPS